jgi:glycosyltransferase involved in cell wall biosynthesis
MLELSVIVPTHKRPELLRRCLASLASQTMDRDRYEVIVVDDGADEGTRQVVEEQASKTSAPAIRYLAMPRRGGPAAARNRGWRIAAGSTIAFTDDDCIALPGWLAAGCSALLDRHVSGVWGKIVVPIPEPPTDHELTTKGLEQSPCATANCFYRREALEQVGGFDERFALAWREDSDLQFMLLARHHRLRPCDEAVVVHPVRPAPWGISLQQQRNNYYNALLYKKHPARYRSTIQAQPPWHYYAAVISLLVAALSAWYGHPTGLWLGGAVWAYVTALFFLHRLRRTCWRPKHVAEMAVTSALIPPWALYWRLRGAWAFRVPFL